LPEGKNIGHAPVSLAMSDEHDFPVKLPATEIAEIWNRRASIEMPSGISCAAKTLGSYRGEGESCSSSGKYVAVGVGA
jgi:hypothetical protein